MTDALAERLVLPELLDHLPVDDPQAQGSRRDLRRINRLMLQPAIMAGLLRANVRSPPRRILEIGSGDGSFMLAVARRLSRHWPEAELLLLDQAPVVSRQCLGAFGALGWDVRSVAADAFEWMEAPGAPSFDLVTTNLFLHHFADEKLARLLAAVHRLAPMFAATEPRRARFPLRASHLLRLIGANAVTLHDADASVRAGFRDRDLAALWPAGAAAVLFEGTSGPFTHGFCAASAVP